MILGKTGRVHRTGAAADHLELLIEKDVVDKGFGALRVGSIVEGEIIDKASNVVVMVL